MLIRVISHNLDFEIAALLLLLLIVFFFTFQKKVNNFQTKLYSFFIMFTGICICSNIIVIELLEHPMNYSNVFHYINITIFLSLQFMLPFFYVLYTFVLVGNISRNQIRFLAFLSLPAILGVGSLLFFNYENNIFFSISASKAYVHGPYFYLLYFNVFFYTMVTITYAFLYHKRLNKMSRQAILGILMCSTISVLVQAFVDNIHTNGFGLTCGIIIMYFTFQNPIISFDNLTGALNRSALLNRCNLNMERGREFHLLAISLSKFKAINNMFGIENGDSIICEISKELSKIVGEDFLYRYNGDVFIVFAYDLKSYNHHLTEIKRYFKHSFNVFDQLTINLTPRLSHILWSNGGMDLSSLFATIDYAIYDLKHQEINSVYEIDDISLEKMKRKVAIEKALERAFQKRKFEVHYQPIYHVFDEKFSSAEALARLYIEGYGYIPPDEFIGIAESNGQILDLGMLILEEVCRFISDSGILLLGIKFIDVNLSMVQCMQETLAIDIIEMVKKYNVNPNMINFEITETGAILSERILINNINKLKTNNFKFSLDDYGTGYSTNSYVIKYPFEIVKIDKELVQNCIIQNESYVILESTVKMLKRLNRRIIAEGVETKEMASRIIALGAECIQGYFYSKPLKKKEFIELLEKQRNEARNKVQQVVYVYPTN